MKKSIYEIGEKQLQLVEALEENGGELTPEIEHELAINEADIQTKGVAYSFVMKELKFTMAQIKEEKDRLDAILKAKQKAYDRLENALSVGMQIFGFEKIETPLVKISFRQSESVEIEDLSLVDPMYKVTKETVTADKAKIKDAIKRGETVIGATISYNKNIQIK